MKDETKAKLDNLKTKIKKHVPEIILGIGGAIGWALAGYYKNELQKRELEHDGYKSRLFETFVIPETIMEELRGGSVLKYRCVKSGDDFDEEYTLGNFPEPPKDEEETEQND